jgi:PhnB protein
MAVNYVAPGYGTVTPYLSVRNVEKLMEFIAKVFGGTEILRMKGGDGRVNHAEMQVGDSKLMMGEAMDDGKIVPAMLCIYVPDCDAVYRKALEAGAKASREPQDQFYGDRSGAVMDAFGNHWFISTHIEDVSAEELNRRSAALR